MDDYTAGNRADFVRQIRAGGGSVCVEGAERDPHWAASDT